MSLAKFDEHWRSFAKVARTNGGEGIPVINLASAGRTVDYDEHGVDSGQGHDYVNRGDVEDDLAFAVRVVGDSMEPSMFQGDLVVFSPVMGIPRPHRPLSSGAVVFDRFSADSGQSGAMIARWFETGGAAGVLVKDNPSYGATPVKQGDLEQLAVAVERRSSRGL